MNQRVHFTSHNQNWKTPKAFYQALNAEFNFDFDPCPPKADFDGLDMEWGESNFVNPPYKDCAKWLKKGWIESRKGKTVVFLIPSRTDTKFWHDYCMRAKEIRFIKGRLHFDDQKNPAPFPSALIIFKAVCVNAVSVKA